MASPTLQQQPPPDRLTQIQDCLGKLGEMMYIAVGATQRDAPLMPLNEKTPVTAWTEEQIRNNTQSVKTLAADVSADMVQTCKVIDYLIDSLPGIHESVEEQLDTLKQLEEENMKAGQDMEEWIKKAEARLAEIDAALQFIAEDQFAYLAGRLDVK